MSTRNVPVISIVNLDDPATLSALDGACRDWGFFQVVDHGIDDVVIDALHRQMRSFFAQPVQTKQALSRTAENPWGFYDQELTKNTRDWKEIFDVGPVRSTGEPGPMQPQWPPGLPAFRPAVEAFYAACERLSFRLLAALSVNLGMPAGYLSRGFEPWHSSFLRLNYYPVCPRPARPCDLTTPTSGYLGINHHTDAGCSDGAAAGFSARAGSLPPWCLAWCRAAS
jgi:isopenicillin N synthase-like dioxygenase